MKKFNPFFLPIYRNLILIASCLLFSWMTNLTLFESSVYWPVICIFANLITIFILFLVQKSEGLTYRDLFKNQIQLQSKNQDLMIVILMILSGIGFMLMFGFLFFGKMPTHMVQPMPVWLAIISLVLLPVSIIFAEFPLYYGYALNGIIKQKGKVFAYFYIVILYALQHAFMPLIIDPKYMIFKVVSFMPLLLIITPFYIQSKRMKPMIIGHFILDFAVSFQILIFSIFSIYL